MPALIDLRHRIRSVRNTQQITQAMKTVATAKFKKAQRAVIEGRPHWHAYPELLDKITAAAAAGRLAHPLLEVRPMKRAVVLVITSDKGLCGAFNSNLLEATRAFLSGIEDGCSVRLVLAGKKSVRYFKRLSYIVEREYAKEPARFEEEDFREVTRLLIRLYCRQETDAVFLAYNEFKSILAPRITIMKLLPLERKGGLSPPSKPTGGVLEKEEFLELPRDFGEGGLSPIDIEAGVKESLLPLYVGDQVRHVFAESAAAEQAARMMAMDNATKNAEELIGDLTLLLNKIRQAMITKELLEIMTAVEALSKK